VSRNNVDASRMIDGSSGRLDFTAATSLLMSPGPARDRGGDGRLRSRRLRLGRSAVLEGIIGSRRKKPISLESHIDARHYWRKIMVRTPLAEKVEVELQVEVEVEVQRSTVFQGQWGFSQCRGFARFSPTPRALVNGRSSPAHSNHQVCDGTPDGKEEAPGDFNGGGLFGARESLIGASCSPRRETNASEK
jgi:hypothetical protein